MGAAVSFVGCVGNDGHGSELLDSLARERIDISGIEKVAGSASGTAMILVNKHAENQIIVIPGANAYVSSNQVDTALAQETVPKRREYCLVGELLMS